METARKKLLNIEYILNSIKKSLLSRNPSHDHIHSAIMVEHIHGKVLEIVQSLPYYFLKDYIGTEYRSDRFKVRVFLTFMHRPTLRLTFGSSGPEYVIQHGSTLRRVATTVNQLIMLIEALEELREEGHYDT